MSSTHSKPATGWQIHPTVNNSLSPLCMLPSGPDASPIERQTAARDTLERASQALAALADKLETDERYGDRLVLNCICGALHHASELLNLRRKPDDDEPQPA